MENKKKSIVVSIMGRLVKKTASRHYYEATDPTWNYTVVPYDIYLSTRRK